MCGVCVQTLLEQIRNFRQRKWGAGTAECQADSSPRAIRLSESRQGATEEEAGGQSVRASSRRSSSVVRDVREKGAKASEAPRGGPKGPRKELSLSSISGLQHGITSLCLGFSDTGVLCMHRVYLAGSVGLSVSVSVCVSACVCAISVARVYDCVSACVCVRVRACLHALYSAPWRANTLSHFDPSVWRTHTCRPRATPPANSATVQVLASCGCLVLAGYIPRRLVVG